MGCKSYEINPFTGKLELVSSGGDDYHSGYNIIESDITVDEKKQMINFTKLTLDETLTLDGDLWLA